jgi:DNA modification methylase
LVDIHGASQDEKTLPPGKLPRPQVRIINGNPDAQHKNPFLDVIHSSPARNEERKMAAHPSLKPQAFMRQIVRAALPLGRGVILDPFMGSGSTIAAAEAVGYSSIGIEKDSAYYSGAAKSIAALARFTPNDGRCIPAARNSGEKPQASSRRVDENRLAPPN